MKMQRRWVTGMAALLLTVGLMGLPREGAAFAIKFLDPGGDPQFGDPDGPDHESLKQVLRWLVLGQPWLIMVTGRVAPQPARLDSPRSSAAPRPLRETRQ